VIAADSQPSIYLSQQQKNMAEFLKSMSDWAIPSNNEPSDEPKVFNSEMDELPLPEGEEMPPLSDILKTAKSVVLEDSPTTPRPGLGISTGSSNVNNSNHSTPTEENDDIGHDVLSVTSDLNRQSQELESLRTAIREINNKLNVLPGLDIGFRKLQTTTDELARKIEHTSSGLTNLQKSFNLHQSAIANKIADVERRAATKQLTLDPKPLEMEEIPPDMVSVSRPFTSVGSTEPNPSPPIVKKKKADMSGW